MTSDLAFLHARRREPSEAVEVLERPLTLDVYARTGQRSTDR
ncbi:MAG: hypothetical protein R2754_12330 [Microthrixaceae bacterium]